MRRIPARFSRKAAADRISEMRIPLAIVFFGPQAAKRLSISILSVAAISVLSLGAVDAVQKDATSTELSRERTVDFKYTFNLTDVPEDARSVKVWIPLPQDSDAQSISNVRVDGAGGFRVVADAKYGNRFAYLELGTEAVDATITATYRVTRCARTDLGAEKIGRPYPKRYADSSSRLRA